MPSKRTPGQIVTRFAPSPTGMFHVGGIRSALYNYLFARKHEGVYILRCEDTDPVRSKKEYEQYFLDVFEWLGLEYDEYYRQSERTTIYRSYLERLIEEGKAYVSKEDTSDEGKRAEVIRFKNPNTKLTFYDEVLGDITFDTTELGDFVIARELDSPLYHFTVVVDDFEMGVTHIIRGQEHVSNTPRQILIQEAIGAPRPVYAHASIILNEERAKLSKRDPTVRPALEYRDEGYLPDAMLNFMALLGWNPGTNQEIYSKDDLIASFSLERMQKPGAVFNPDKLEWINKEHMKLVPPEKLIATCLLYLSEETVSVLESHPKRDALLQLLLERITHYGQIRELEQTGELSYFFKAPTIDTPTELLWKKLRDTPDGKRKTIEHLEQVRTLINGTVIPLTADSWKTLLWDYAEQVGRGDVLWPLRYSLSGREKSPDPFQLLELLGKEESLTRISNAIKLLQTQ